jgi:hypothetical protein
VGATSTIRAMLVRPPHQRKSSAGTFGEWSGHLPIALLPYPWTRWGMSRAELEKRILRLHKGGTGILKIGKTLGIGTGTVQRVLMEQSRPFDVGVAEAAFASQ